MDVFANKRVTSGDAIVVHAAVSTECGVHFPCEAPMHWSKLTEARATAPVLLLGLGNPQMSDQGVGKHLLNKLRSCASELGEGVEFVDGSVQALARPAPFEGRKAVVFLDAIHLGDKPGAVHVFFNEELTPGNSASQIIAEVESCSGLPEEIAIIGIEPERVEAGIYLSPAVEASLGVAAGLARMAINRMLCSMPDLQLGGRHAAACREEKLLV